MDTVVVIGSALEVAGFRLAGVDVRTPAPPQLDAEFERALGSAAALVVVGARAAAALAPGVLERAQTREAPLVVVLPDVAQPRADAAFERRLRGVLGIDA